MLSLSPMPPHLSVGDFQALAGQAQSGTPLITHDPASVSDIQVVEIVDTVQSPYIRANYGDTYPGYVSPNDGATLYSDFVLIDEVTATFQYIRRIWQALPGSWLYTVSVDDTTLAFLFEKQRKAVAANILERAIVYTGASGAITSTLTATSVTSLTIGTPGTKYGDYVGLIFAAAPAGGRTAQGYATAVAGIITGYVITDPGLGYLSAPAVTVLPNSLLTVERKDINSYVAYEVWTWITQPPAYSVGTALLSYSSEYRDMPGRINIPFLRTYYPIINDQTPYSINVLVTIKSYWVISDVAPTITLDSMYPDDILVPIGQQYINFRKVLHDAASLTYVDGIGNSITLFWAATVPSYTEYTGYIIMTGTITFTNGSAAVTGSGSNFSALVAGNLINGSTSLQVLSVTNNTNMTLTSVFTGTTTTLTNYYAVNTATAWIGNLKNIAGGVTPEKWQKLYRVDLKYMVMR